MGLEEGLFPHIRSLDSPTAIEEERRLMYVAVTRAGDTLHMTLARKRSMVGRGFSNQGAFSSTFTIPSRFLKEITPGLVSGFYPSGEEELRRAPNANPSSSGFGGNLAAINQLMPTAPNIGKKIIPRILSTSKVATAIAAAATTASRANMAARPAAVTTGLPRKAAIAPRKAAVVTAPRIMAIHRAALREVLPEVTPAIPAAMVRALARTQLAPVPEAAVAQAPPVLQGALLTGRANLSRSSQGPIACPSQLRPKKRSSSSACK